MGGGARDFLSGAAGSFEGAALGAGDGDRGGVLLLSSSLPAPGCGGDGDLDIDGRDGPGAGDDGLEV